MRLVLDTNVVASAMLWGGTPRTLFEKARERKVEIFTSMPLLAELTDVLSRDKFKKKIAASLLTVDQLVDRYVALAGIVRPVKTPRIAPDPDDDIVIGTALAAKADLIVSGDSHLIELNTYGEIKIVTPAAVVARFK